MANILIVGAMPEEVERVQDWLKGELCQVKRKEPLPYWVKAYKTHTLYLIQSGIGKVAGAVSVSALLDLFPVDYIINAGSAGGLEKEQKVGDIILANEVAYHDVDVTGFNYAWGQIPKMPARYPASVKLLTKAKIIAKELDFSFHTGLIISGDSFIHTKEQVKVIKEYFPEAIAVEMEAGAIAQVAYLYGVPYLVIRALSDKADSDSPSDFPTFLRKASETSSQLIKKIIESL